MKFHINLHLSKAEIPSKMLTLTLLVQHPLCNFYGDRVFGNNNNNNKRQQQEATPGYRHAVAWQKFLAKRPRDPLRERTKGALFHYHPVRRRRRRPPSPPRHGISASSRERNQEPVRISVRVGIRWLELELELELETPYWGRGQSGRL